MSTHGFAVILVEPQLGENIGMVARAMWNCGLNEMRLVSPRDGWPSEPARKSASGADIVIDGAKVFKTTADAIADLDTILATTARPRDMTIPVYTPAAAARELRTKTDSGVRTGVLFGRESWGLHNDDVALADAVITVPLNPAFTSLNLAQAVLLLSYEWHKITDDTVEHELRMPNDTRPATKEELIRLFEHLESALDDAGFFRVTEKRPTMVRNLRNLLGRAEITEKEIRMLRGIVNALVKHSPDKAGS